MCKALNIYYNILIKLNHKSLTLKRFRRFLHKVTAIEMEDRQIKDVFEPVEISAGYAWNSTQTDATNIFRSIVTIGCKFRFPFDINSSVLPQLTQKNAQSVIKSSFLFFYFEELN